MIKRILASLVALAALASAAATAQAEWMPGGPIKMLIGFRAGGGADTQARLIAEELEERHGWKIIPEQMTGKGGAVLAAALKEEPADGTAIGIIVTESLGYNMVAAKNAGYQQSDFTALTTTAGFQMGIVALTSKGWNTFDELVEAARAGEQIRFGAMSPKLADLAYLLGKAHGIEFNIVMTQGGKGVMDGLNAGDLDIGWGAGIQNNAVLAGDMINLASGLSTRLMVSPDAPTINELGLPFSADGYFIFVSPDGIPAEAREALSSAIASIVSDGDTEAGGFIEKAFGGSVVIAGEELDALLAAEEAAAAALLEEASR
ncbi:MAG: tripartite tricarboxylate transporter substrate-binding protein [Albidovulum sp.]|nr:tripartite tricarboxylate transporter substrate-binding protein [Albidovulum sp.]